MKPVKEKLERQMHGYSKHISDDVFDIVSNIQQTIWWNIDMNIKDIIILRVKKNETSY